MFALVLNEVALVDAGLVAVLEIALVGLRAAMDAEVRHQIAFLSERFLAVVLGADEGSLTGMQTHVYFKAASAGILLLATLEGAHEGLFARMRQLMRLQMSFRYEMDVATLADERPFARVLADVSLQIPSLRKVLQTRDVGAVHGLNFRLWPLHPRELLYTNSAGLPTYCY